MTRIQIQLTEEQLKKLKNHAAASGRSLSDLVREGVDRLLLTGPAAAREERRARALQAVGRFASASSDGSRDHDRHLADAFLKQ